MPDTLHTCEDLKAAALAGSQTITYLAAKLRELGRCVPARRACVPPDPTQPNPPPSPRGRRSGILDLEDVQISDTAQKIA